MSLERVRAYRLTWEARELAVPLLEGVSERFGEREQFEAWRDGLLASLLSGFTAVVLVERAGAPVGALVAQGRGGCRAVVAAVGELEPTALAAAFEALRADADHVVWDAEVLPGWEEALAPLGARPYQRQTLVQEIARAWIPELPDDGVTVQPWERGTAMEAEALEAMAQAMADSLGGVFLTLPEAPTVAACRAVLERALGGAAGEWLPWASGLAVADGRLAGALMCVRGEHERQGFLFQIVACPGVRKRLLARRLIVHMQRELLARGFTEILFLTLDANAPVHRLYRPEELVRADHSPGGYWRR